MKRVLQMANILSLILAIAVNYISNSMAVNGNTVGSVSDKYHNLLTPADYAFSIWAVIYIALICFVIYQGRGLLKSNVKDEFVLISGWWFVLANLANIAWIFSWLNEWITLSLMFMLVIFFSLFRILLLLNIARWDAPVKTIAFIWWPLTLYLGWIIIALFANITAWFRYISWPENSSGEENVTVILLLIVTAVYLLMIWKRHTRLLALAGIWGIVAVGITNWGVNPQISWFAFLSSLIIFIFISIQAARNLSTNPIVKLLKSKS